MPFIRIIVVGTPLRPMPWLALGSWPENSARYGFHLLESNLNPTGKWLVILITVGPLLYQNLVWATGKSSPATCGWSPYFVDDRCELTRILWIIEDTFYVYTCLCVGTPVDTNVSMYTYDSVDLQAPATIFCCLHYYYFFLVFFRGRVSYRPGFHWLWYTLCYQVQKILLCSPL